MREQGLHASTEIEKWTRLAMRRWISEMGGRLKHGLPIQQYYLLESLRANGTMRCSELADTLQITLPAVTNLANKLVAGGYAERAHNETDRRVVMVTVTPKGLDALRELDEKAAELVEWFWQGLEPGETAELTRMLRKAVEYRTAVDRD